LIVNGNAPTAPLVPSMLASISATSMRPVAPTVRLQDLAGVLLVKANSLSAIFKKPFTVILPFLSPEPVPSTPSIDTSPVGSVIVRVLAPLTIRFRVLPAILL
jgi:hypothetical protein